MKPPEYDIEWDIHDEDFDLFPERDLSPFGIDWDDPCDCDKCLERGMTILGWCSWKANPRGPGYFYVHIFPDDHGHYIARVEFVA